MFANNSREEIKRLVDKGYKITNEDICQVIKLGRLKSLEYMMEERDIYSDKIIVSEHSILDWSIKNNQYYIVKYLLTKRYRKQSYDTYENPLSLSLGDFSMFYLVFKNMPDIENAVKFHNKNNRNIFHYFGIRKQSHSSIMAKIVSYFNDDELNAYLVEKDNLNQTPLINAIKHGSLDTVRMFLNKPCDLTFNDNKVSALMEAVEKMDADMISMIVRYIRKKDIEIPFIDLKKKKNDAIFNSRAMSKPGNEQRISALFDVSFGKVAEVLEESGIKFSPVN